MLGSPDPDCVTVIVGMAKQRTSDHFGNSSVDEDSFRIKKTTLMIASDLGNRALSYPQIGRRKLSLSVIDNCLVRFDTSFEVFGKLVMAPGYIT